MNLKPLGANMTEVTAGDIKLWILNAAETSEFDVLYQFLIEKAKGA